jgi:hypothetical protein
MIIIEGLDESGKTTLAKYLAKELGIRTHHFGGPPKTYREFYSRCVQSTLMFGRRIIQDRCPFISELVYGHLRDSDPFIKQDVVIKQLFDPFFAPLIIYCRPTGHEWHEPKNHDDDPQFRRVAENWSTLQMLYDNVMAKLKVYHYNWTQPDLNMLLERILGVAREKLKLIETLRADKPHNPLGQ